MSNQRSLAQYALRCSRELPTCSKCREWGGECIYSRHGRIPRRPRSNVSGTQNSPVPQYKRNQPKQPTSDSASASPSAVPSSISSSKSYELANSQTDDNYVDSFEHKSASERLMRNEEGQSFHIGPSPTTNFLSQASSNIDILKDNLEDPRQPQNAENSLSDLSNAFAAVNFQDTGDIRKNVRCFRKNNEAFFIPSKEEGLHLMETFLSNMMKGSPMFSTPPSHLLSKIVFEPSKVEERAWLLLFNVIASTAVSSMEQPDQRLVRGFQWNTWMLVEDASIILDASEINIQALVLAASHGQEISTPSLCWTLVSRACQMAQTLGLHLPTARAPLHSEANSQRNFLFWGLYSIDKGLSLSFGRPPLLPSHLYKNVPLPDPKIMARFNPELVMPQSLNVDAGESYGGFHFLQGLKLSQIQGEISDLTYSDERLRSIKSTDLKIKLDAWWDNVEKWTSIHPSTSQGRSDLEAKAIQIGLDVSRFQYHHLVVYLTRADPSQQEICLSSARSAITVLENLVASSTEVYNGIVWQLLYQPFTPYFVIFTHIISSPDPTSCFKDLQLLRQVVLYFLQMHNNHPSARKLEKVAETFTRLAEAYIRHSMERAHSTSTGTSFKNSQVMKNAGAGVEPEQPIPNPLSRSLDPPGQPSSESEISTLPSLTSSESEFPSYFVTGSTDPPSDPLALLNFFSTSSGTANSSHLPSIVNSHPAFASTPSAETGGLSYAAFEGADLGELDCALGAAEPFEWTSDSVMRELQMFGQDVGIDGTFDWLSWEQFDLATL